MLITQLHAHLKNDHQLPTLIYQMGSGKFGIASDGDIKEGFIMNTKRVALLSLLAFLFTGYALAQTRDLPRPPTASEFQRTIPENAEFRTTRTVNGREAVLQLRANAGLDVGALARFNISDPLLTGGTSLRSTIQHSEFTSREQALIAAQPDWGTAQANVGDTITETWTEGGWSYSATWTWNGSEWELTAFSAHKDTRQEP